MVLLRSRSHRSRSHRINLVATGLVLLSAGILLPAPTRAELPLVAADEIPVRLARADSNGIHVFTRISLDEHQFNGFSLGGSDDLPAVEADRLRALVSGIGPNQWLFVQATADTTRWHGQRKKDNHRLDVSVAIARTLWGLDHLDRKRVTTLPPRLSATERELVVYVATYDETVIPFPAQAQPVAQEPPAPSPVPETMVVREVESSPLGIGLEAGMALLSAGDLTMATPAVGLVFEKKEVRLDFAVGWSPSGDNELGDLADATAQATLSWFPRGGHFGPFVGWVAGSEFVRDVAEYVLFAHGPALGGTARAHYWVLDGSLRIGYARVNLDELDQENDWSNGFVLNIQAGMVF